MKRRTKKRVRALAVTLAAALTLMAAVTGLVLFRGNRAGSGTSALASGGTGGEDGLIRVLLQSLGRQETLNVTFNGAYSVNGESGFRFDRGTAVTLVEGSGSVWLLGGGMHIDLGSSVTLKRHAAPEGSANGMYIGETGRTTLYNGDLTVSASEGSLRAVLEIGVEDYLCGVIAYEMSDAWPLEALKAQAVAARTYALGRKAASSGRDYDVTDTTSDQVFRGYNPDYTNVAAAVRATAGVVGIYKGGYAVCYYTASNGGQTALPTDVWSNASGDYGYLARRDDPYDLENPKAEVRSVTFRTDASDNAALLALLQDGADAQIEEPFTLLAIASVTPSAPVPAETRRYTKVDFELRCRIETDAPSADGSVLALPEERTVTVSLELFDQLKELLGLGINGGSYELLTVTAGAGTYTLETRRFGHGVGMSQRGAQRMAGHYDMGYEEILAFYFPGMTLKTFTWQAPALTELDAGDGYSGPMPTATPAPTPAPLPELDPGEYYAYVTLNGVASALNVRSGPSTGTEILDRFPEGRRLIVCSEPDADGWVRIRTSELRGYVKLEYLTAE